MNRVGSKGVVRRIAAALVLSAAPFVAVERGEAACSPDPVADNGTVTCGDTTDQSGIFGFSSSPATGVTITVQSGATVKSTSTGAGIFTSDGTIINLGTIQGQNKGALGSGGLTVSNSGSIAGVVGDGISIAGTANVTNETAGSSITGGTGGPFGIHVSDGDATVVNAGTISQSVDDGAAIKLDTTGSTLFNANVTNTNLIEASGANAIGISTNGTATVSNNSNATTTGIIRADGQNGIAIQAKTVNVTSNAGTISAGMGAGNTGGVAIDASNAGGTATVTSSGTIQASSIAIVSDGLLTLDNAGLVTSSGAFAVVSNNGDVSVSQNATAGNAAAITAPNVGSIAIQAAGTATVANVDDGSSGASALILAGTSAIKGQTVTVTANTGLIAATVANGVAISATGNADVTNSGTIQAVAANGAAISAGVIAKVSNSIGGTITGDQRGIIAPTVNVTSNAGTISANGQNSIAIKGDVVTVASNSGTIEAGMGAGITGGVAINASSPGGTATVTNSGTIQASSIAIVTDGLLTLDNIGSVTSTGSFAVVSNNGDVSVNQNVSGNTGTIKAATTSATAIQAAGTATVANIGNGTTTGVISARLNAINAGTVTVTSNTGLIEATAAGVAIKATGNADVTNSGAIRALGTGGIAIQAGAAATLSNMSGGIILGNIGGISAGGLNVTNAAGAAIGGGSFGISGSGTVTNAGAITGAQAVLANGTATVSNSNLIQGISQGIFATDVTVTGNSGTIKATDSNGIAIQATQSATVTNLANGTIAGNSFGISAGTLDVTNAAGATISGAIGIQGAGSVTNAGTITGTTASVQFTGTGTNTLTLQTGSVLNGDAIGALGGAVNKLVLEGHGTASNAFFNFGTLDVNADATGWTWTSNSGIGLTRVNSGALVVDGGLSGAVNVNASGTLAGQGTIVGSLTVAGGTVAPGAAVPFSTLKVTGDVNFQPSSIYRVSVNAAGQHDVLQMTGVNNTTSLGGTVNVLAQNGTYAPSTQYTIVTAQSGDLGGTNKFAGVTSNLAFLSPTLSYDANDVFLTLMTNGTVGGGGGFGFVSAAQTRNQAAVAGALDASPAGSSLVTALLNQTVAGARAAFDALSGELFGSVHNTQGQEASFTRSAILGRLRQASYADVPSELGVLGFAGPELAYGGDDASAARDAYAAMPGKAPARTDDRSRGLTFWAQGLGGWGHSGSDGNAASLKSRFGGFLSGADARFGDTWRAGLVAGYMRSDLNVADRSSSAGIDSVQFGGYAGGRFGALNVRGGASYSYDSIDTSRTIAFPGFSDQTKARFHGDVGQVFGEVGHGMALGHVAFEPFAGLAYVHLRDGSFLESGGVAALSGSRTGENIGYSSLGLRAATAVPLANGTVLVPRASLQWQYAFGDVATASALAFQSTGAGFTAAGIPIARNSALVEAGFDWRFSPWAKLGAFYQGELAAHAQSHAFKGAFTWDF